MNKSNNINESNTNLRLNSNNNINNIMENNIKEILSELKRNIY